MPTGPPITASSQSLSLKLSNIAAVGAAFDAAHPPRYLKEERTLMGDRRAATRAALELHLPMILSVPSLVH